MELQLLVPLAAGLVVLAVVCAVKLHHASQVFDGIIRQIDQGRADELAKRRDDHAEDPPHLDHRSGNRQSGHRR
jgi:hypothetical protein